MPECRARRAAEAAHRGQDESSGPPDGAVPTSASNRALFFSLLTVPSGLGRIVHVISCPITEPRGSAWDAQPLTPNAASKWNSPPGSPCLALLRQLGETPTAAQAGSTCPGWFLCFF